MEYKYKRLIDIVIRLLAVGLLIWALESHPYNYYKLLRWVVCGVTAYITFLSIKQERYFWAILTGIFALLFNPLIPFHLDRDVWQIIDLIAAGEIITTIFFIRLKKTMKRMEQ